LKKDTQGFGVHTPSGRKETDEVFLMIVLFYEGVKGKTGIGGTGMSA